MHAAGCCSGIGECRLPETATHRDTSTKLFVIPVSYTWFPPRCSTCSKWGHETKGCVVQKDPTHKNKNFEHQETRENESLSITIPDTSPSYAPGTIPIMFIQKNRQ